MFGGAGGHQTRSFKPSAWTGVMAGRPKSSGRVSKQDASMGSTAMSACIAVSVTTPESSPTPPSGVCKLAGW